MNNNFLKSLKKIIKELRNKIEKKTIFQICAIFSLTLIFFVLLNILISYTWRFYNDYKYQTNNPFPLHVRKAYILNDKDQSILHKNVYDLKFRYTPYLGAVPKNYKSKFVNFEESNGRKIINPKFCDKKVFFFGGSTTFLRPESSKTLAPPPLALGTVLFICKLIKLICLPGYCD
jgi:hypothetical protein